MRIFHLAHARHEESPRSVMMRTAHANGFGSVSSMARAFGAKESLQPFAWQMKHSKLVGQLASHKHLNGEQFQASFYTQLGRTNESPVEVMGLSVPSISIRTGAYSFCPDCIKVGNHSSILDLTWLNSCPYHDCKLESACPNCQREVQWTQLSGPLCQCGFDLGKTSKTHYHSRSSHQLLNIFRAKDQPAIDRFIFALRALRYATHSEQAQSPLETAARIADCDAAVFEEIMHESSALYPCLSRRPLLAPWMVSEDAWIKSQVQYILNTDADTTRSKGQCNCSELKLFQDEMTHALKSSATKLRSLLTRDLIQREKGNKTRWKYSAKKLCLLLEQPMGITTSTLQSIGPLSPVYDTGEHLTIEEAAIRLGVYPEAVRSVHLRGFMQEGHKKGAHGRTLLANQAVEAFSNKYVFVGQLATELGLPKTTLAAKLLHLEVLPISGPELDGSLVTVYRQHDINNKVRAALKSLAHYKSKAGRKPAGQAIFSDGDSTSSTDTARRLGVVMHDLKHLEQQGYLIRARNFRTGRHFTNESVANTEAKLQSMLPLKSFSAQLGMTSQTFSRRFIQSGFLKYVRIGLKTLISKEYVSQIREHRDLFVSACEADEILGAPIGHTANLVRLKKLNPILPNETGYISTVRLLRRHDVNEIK